MECPINLGKLTESIEALRQHQKTTCSTSAVSSLFDDNEVLYVHFILVKVPSTLSGIATISVHLPHPYRQANVTSTCLFVKDLDDKKWDADIDKSARLFKDALTYGKNVRKLDQIIALRQLKREFKTYEAKRKLASAYDVFLADKRVLPQVQRNLGKAFHEKKKLPIGIRLTGGDIDAKIQEVLDSTHFYVKPSSTRCCVKVGKLSQPTDHLVDNICAVVTEMQRKFPGKFNNVRSVYLTGEKSEPMLPVYMSLESPNLVVLPAPKTLKGAPVIGELTTLDEEEDGGERVIVYPNGSVRVFTPGAKKVKPKKKRLNNQGNRRLRKKTERVKERQKQPRRNIITQ